jgi:hypothetical protein
MSTFDSDSANRMRNLYGRVCGLELLTDDDFVYGTKQENIRLLYDMIKAKMNVMEPDPITGKIDEEELCKDVSRFYREHPEEMDESVWSRLPLDVQYLVIESLKYEEDLDPPSKQVRLKLVNKGFKELDDWYHQRHPRDKATLLLNFATLLCYSMSELLMCGFSLLRKDAKDKYWSLMQVRRFVGLSYPEGEGQDLSGKEAMQKANHLYLEISPSTLLFQDPEIVKMFQDRKIPEASVDDNRNPEGSAKESNSPLVGMERKMFFEQYLKFDPSDQKASQATVLISDPDYGSGSPNERVATEEEKLHDGKWSEVRTIAHISTGLFGDIPDQKAWDNRYGIYHKKSQAIIDQLTSRPKTDRSYPIGNDGLGIAPEVYPLRDAHRLLRVVLSREDAEHVAFILHPIGSIAKCTTIEGLGEYGTSVKSGAYMNGFYGGEMELLTDHVSDKKYPHYKHLSSVLFLAPSMVYDGENRKAYLYRNIGYDREEYTTEDGEGPVTTEEIVSDSRLITMNNVIYPLMVQGSFNPSIHGNRKRLDFIKDKLRVASAFLE